MSDREKIEAILEMLLQQHETTVHNIGRIEKDLLKYEAKGLDGAAGLAQSLIRRYRAEEGAFAAAYHMANKIVREN